jgi:hypothetical protein
MSAVEDHFSSVARSSPGFQFRISFFFSFWGKVFSGTIEGASPQDEVASTLPLIPLHSGVESPN